MCIVLRASPGFVQGNSNNNPVSHQPPPHGSVSEDHEGHSKSEQETAPQEQELDQPEP